MTAIARKQDNGRRTKVKTGCTTCRIRKIKCDESKPSCQKCVKTGRSCDGYQSLFKNTSGPIAIKGPTCASSDFSTLIRPAVPEISSRDVDLLKCILSTKTMFDIKLDCGDEARQILQASSTNAPLRHAIWSLRALREDFEATKGPSPGEQKSASHNYGLEQYSMALQGLMYDLSSPGLIGLKSALFCCQIFISIEQTREDYAAMIEHIIRGLKIMREHRTRPCLVDSHVPRPAIYARLPLLDVFVIKLFAAPCKFADAVATTDTSGMTVSVRMLSSQQHPAEYPDLRTIAPDWRGQLTRIATSTLEFLAKVSEVETSEQASQLLHEKESLLKSLSSWLASLKLIQKTEETPGSEAISVTFLRIFHSILTIILLGTIDSSQALENELLAETKRVRAVANSVCERVRLYRTCGGAKKS